MNRSVRLFFALAVVGLISFASGTGPAPAEAYIQPLTCDIIWDWGGPFCTGQMCTHAWECCHC
jgi:hypothetical protein